MAQMARAMAEVMASVVEVVVFLLGAAVLVMAATEGL